MSIFPKGKSIWGVRHFFMITDGCVGGTVQGTLSTWAFCLSGPVFSGLFYIKRCHWLIIFSSQCWPISNTQQGRISQEFEEFGDIEWSITKREKHDIINCKSLQSCAIGFKLIWNDGLEFSRKSNNCHLTLTGSLIKDIS